MDTHSCNKCGQDIIIRYLDGKPTPIHIDGCCNTDSLYIEKINTEEWFNERQKKRRHEARKIIHSLTIPNASCPECGSKVFYYENEHGSKVFFDSLGPPWPKHPCTDLSENSNQSKKTFSRKWKQFYIREMQNRQSVSGHITIWRGFSISVEGDIGATYELYSLSELNLQSVIHKRYCFWRKKGQNSYLINFINRGNGNMVTELNAFLRKDFIQFFENGDIYGNLNRKGKEKFGSKRNLRTREPHEIPKLIPRDDSK